MEEKQKAKGRPECLFCLDQITPKINLRKTK